MNLGLFRVGPAVYALGRRGLDFQFVVAKIGPSFAAREQSEARS